MVQRAQLPLDPDNGDLNTLSNKPEKEKETFLEITACIGRLTLEKTRTQVTTVTHTEEVKRKICNQVATNTISAPVVAPN